MRWVGLVLSLWAIASTTLAHQDMIIRLALDGQLEGLPPIYQPASLRLPTVDDRQLVVLQLRGKRLEFPDCLSVLFAKASRPHIALSASWYHDQKILPPYLSIRLPMREPNGNGYYDGWSILVDMDKVKVLRVEAVFTIGSKAQRMQEVDIGKFCGSGGTIETLGKIR
jgi:hypothetical protein